MRKWVIIIASSLIGCEYGDYQFTLPIMQTLPIEEVTQQGVMLKAIVRNAGNTDAESFGFLWSYDEVGVTLTHSAIIQGKWRVGTYDLTINNELLKDKEYSVRFFAKVNGRTLYSNEQKFMSRGTLPPTITEITPGISFEGSVITIHGEKFFNNRKYTQVFVHGQPAQIVSATTSKLEVVVPRLIALTTDAVDIKVVVDGQETVLSRALKIYVPSVLSISPGEGRVGELVEIRGENLSLPNVKTIIQGGTEFVIEAELPDPNLVRFRFPQIVVHPTPIGPRYLNMNIRVGLLKDWGSETRYSFEIPFKFLNLWNKEMEAPIIGGAGIAFGEQIYWVGTAQDYAEEKNQVWSFNTMTNQWTHQTNLPPNGASMCFAVGSEDRIFVGFCSDDPNIISVSEYNLSNNQWNFVFDLVYDPFDPLRSAVVTSEKLYLKGINWMKHYNFESRLLSDNLSPPQRNASSKFIKIDSKVYLIGSEGGELTNFELESETDTWRSLPVNLHRLPGPDFVFSGTRIGGFSKNNILFTFDPNQSDSWRENQYFVFPDFSSGVFLNGKFYVINDKSLYALEGNW